MSNRRRYVQFQAVEVEPKDLKLGDCFSAAGPWYWEGDDAIASRGSDVSLQILTRLGEAIDHDWPRVYRVDWVIVDEEVREPSIAVPLRENKEETCR